MFSEINQMLCASVPILIVAFRLDCRPRHGSRSHHLRWRLERFDPYPWRRLRTSVRYGFQIADGMVINGGGITRSGTVRVIVRSGGRLGRNRGGGPWRGQGTSGYCHGTRVAERRE
jgi:hypothetical protein